MYANKFYRHGKPINLMCKDGQVIYQNVSHYQEPVVEEEWVLLSTLDNTTPFDAIAWDTGYTTQYLDLWISEKPGIESDELDWYDDGGEDNGWFGVHRWNSGKQYSCTFLEEQYSTAPDTPDVEFGIAVCDRDMDSLTPTSFTIDGVVKSAYMLEFNQFTGWTACYGAYSASSRYGDNVYVRPVPKEIIFEFEPTSLTTIRLFSSNYTTGTSRITSMTQNGVNMNVTDSIMRFAGHYKIAMGYSGNTIQNALFGTYDSPWLKTIYIPPQMSVLGQSAFAATATGLTNITLYNSVSNAKLNSFNFNNPNYPSVSGIQYAGGTAIGCVPSTLPTDVTFKPDTRYIGAIELGARVLSGVTSVTIPKYCYKISDCMFYNFNSTSRISSITLEGKITTITQADTLPNDKFRLPSTGTAYLPDGVDNDLFISYLPSGWQVQYY